MSDQNEGGKDSSSGLLHPATTWQRCPSVQKKKEGKNKAIVA